MIINKIKSDIHTYDRFKNIAGYNYRWNDIPSENQLKENEIRAIVCLFDHIQHCPNARIVTDNNEIYFSSAKTGWYKSIDNLEKYLDKTRKKYPGSPLLFYLATRDKITKKYKVRWGYLCKNL